MCEEITPGLIKCDKTCMKGCEFKNDKGNVGKSRVSFPPYLSPFLFKDTNIQVRVMSYCFH